MMVHLTTTVAVQQRSKVVSTSSVLQACAAVCSLLDFLSALHEIVATARAFSTVAVSPPPSPRALGKKSLLDPSVEVDFWTEKIVLRGSQTGRSAISLASSPSSDEIPTKRASSPSAVEASSLRMRSSPSRSNFFSRLFHGDSGKNQNRRSADNATAEAELEAEESLAPELPKHGSLNQLIEAITHTKLYSEEYMRCFVATYESFTTPAIFLRKLLERYAVPESVKPSDGQLIKQRVVNVLIHWIESQPDDLDERAVHKIQNLAASEALGSLQKAIAALQTARKNRIAVFETPLTECGAIQGDDTPSDLILRISSGEIARQVWEKTFFSLFFFAPLISLF